jgi:hypothetical protein
MKKIMITLILLINILTSHASAGGQSLGSAAVASALIGTIYTMNSSMYKEWLDSEVHDWKYDETDLTTSLSRTCDLNLELRLHSTRRISYIVLVIHNQTDKASTIKVGDISTAFANGGVRKLKSNSIVSDYKLDAGWTMQGAFPLDDKSDVADTNFIDVSIPVVLSDGKTACELKGRLNRNANRKPEYDDYHRLLTLEVGFWYGQNLIASNSLKSSSAQQGFFGFNANVYAFENYGFTFGVFNQDLKSDNTAAVRKEKNISGNLKLLEENLFVGVAGNFLIGKKLSTTVSLGLLAHRLENSDDQRAGTIVKKTGVFANGTFNYVFYSSELLPVRGDYMIGLGLISKFIPKYTVGTAQFGGISLAPYANFGFAY